MELRKIKTGETQRVETGPVQFDDDHPGLFIRGDRCAGLVAQLRGLQGNSRLLREYASNGVGQLLELLNAPLRVG